MPQCFKTHFGEVKSKFGHTASITKLLGESDIYDEYKKVMLKQGNIYKYYWQDASNKVYMYTGWYEEDISQTGYFNVFEIHDPRTQETITDPKRISYICGGIPHYPSLTYLSSRAKRYHKKYTQENEKNQRDTKRSDNFTSQLFTSRRPPKREDERVDQRWKWPLIA